MGKYPDRHERANACARNVSQMAKEDNDQANPVLNVVDSLLKDETFKCTGAARVRVLCELVGDWVGDWVGGFAASRPA